MRVLIVHNQLWAHYKAIIFNELQKLSVLHPDFKLHVVQAAIVERSRLSLGNVDLSGHQYSYDLLHNGALEDISEWQKFKGILRNINQFKPDIVNLTGFYELSTILILFYCKWKGIKTILSNESTAMDLVRIGWKEKLKSFIVRKFDGYFNFGTLSANYVLKLGAKPDQILVKRNCVDNQALREIFNNCLPEKNSIKQSLGLPERNFIFVGRLIEEKNLYRLLEAFQKTQQENISEQWGLILLGDGVLKESLGNFVKENKINNIHFVDGMTWDKVPEYLCLSDVLVLPSTYEPWGLVVNEAMACGMPVLVSEQCGCHVDLVQNGKNGYTFNPLDTGEITDTLLKMMHFGNELSKFGNYSEKIIREYSPQNVAKEMFDGFKKICLPAKL